MQRFEFVVCNVGAVVFLEAVNEKPATAFIGGNQSSGATALATPSQPDSLFDHAAALFGIDQTLRHFDDGGTKQLVSQFRFAHLSGEMTGFEDSFHFFKMPLSTVVNWEWLHPEIQRLTLARMRPRWLVVAKLQTLPPVAVVSAEMALPTRQKAGAFTTMHTPPATARLVRALGAVKPQPIVWQTSFRLLLARFEHHFGPAVFALVKALVGVGGLVK